ncbi:MAG: NAD-dependent epimerase/dehydratase family protein [Pseudonocardiaceae bacterium]
MSEILVTGGHGFVGTYLRQTLSDRPVRILARNRSPAQPNETWTEMDLARPVTLSGSSGSTLCHLAYARADAERNIDYNLHLLDAVNSCQQIHHVLLMSSASVYGSHATGTLDEVTPCGPRDEYSRTKLACETVWTKHLRISCGLTVLRPTEIIGPGGMGLVFLVRDALQRPVVGIFKRSLHQHRSVHFVAVRNVVAAVKFLLDRQVPTGRETYVVSDDHQPENRSYAEMQDTVRRVSGKSPLPSIPAPRWVVRAVGTMTNRPLTIRRTFSSDALHAAGFHDAVPLRDEVQRTVQALLAGAILAHMA